MKKLMLFVLSSIGIYGICSFIVWDQNIVSWPWWMRAIFVFWSLIVLGKFVDSK